MCELRDCVIQSSSFRGFSNRTDILGTSSPGDMTSGSVHDLVERGLLVAGPRYDVSIIV